MATTVFGTTLVQETCCNCGIAFAVPADFFSACQADTNKWFYCPNGHKQHYSESEATRLKKQLETERASRQFYEKQQAETAKERDNLSKSLKSANTRMRNLKTRVANGVCPCCNRQFGNLHRHMAHMHPAYKP